MQCEGTWVCWSSAFGLTIAWVEVQLDQSILSMLVFFLFYFLYAFEFVGKCWECDEPQNSENIPKTNL